MGDARQARSSGEPHGPRDAAYWAALLREQGYCIVRQAMPSGAVAALADDLAPAFERTAPSQGPFYGASSKRFHGLLRRSPRAAKFVVHDLVVGIAETVLGPFCDRIQLNLTQAIELLPGADMQPPHRDEEMWPIRQASVEYLVNAMWPLTPYTAENGATLLWDRSHRREKVDIECPVITAEMAPGDVLLFLGSTLHAGGANRTALPRRGVIVSYSLGWLKPYELPWLAYPPVVAKDFPPALAALAGYRAHRPNLGTYEGRCPSTLLEGPAGAIDSLLPEQEVKIAAFRDMQRGA